MMILLRILLWRPKVTHLLIAVACLALFNRVSRVGVRVDEWRASSVITEIVAGGSVEAASADKPEEVSKEPSKKPEAPAVLPGEKKKEEIGTFEDKIAGKKRKREDEFDPLALDPSKTKDVDPNNVKVLEALSKVGKAENTTKKETELSAVTNKVNEQLEKMAKLKSEIEAKTKVNAELSKKEMAELVKTYEKMKPQNAATILEQIPQDVVLVELLRHMKPEKMAAILQAMNPKRAAPVTVELAKNGILLAHPELNPDKQPKKQKIEE